MSRNTAQGESQHIQFISAGAGSGKTFRLAKELGDLLSQGDVRPAGVIATTFTRLAASELRERVRQKLMESGEQTQAARMGQALIGTVNGICGELLSRFVFEAGLSPDQKVLIDQEAVRLFGQSLELVLGDQPDRIRELNALARRLSLMDGQQPEWRREVMKVAETARANNMSPDQIRDWGKDSADSLLAWFPEPYAADARDLNAELLSAVKQALADIDTTTDTTKGTQSYVDHLEEVQAKLEQKRLTWSEWAALSKKKPTKQSLAAAEPAQIIAGDYEKHAQLHRDIRRICDEVFQLAADTMSAYQSAKARQGLLDFVDQEQRLYQLLASPDTPAHVRESLKDELQVLLVDEFQDTSPIELALFMKLADLADRVIWVGDLKQSIFGFRGSDPQLMQATLEAVMDGGGRTDVLPKSWRSRPALVEYANQLFTPAFADTLPAHQVTLEPTRKEQSDDPAVECWHLSGSNLKKRARDMAQGILQLVEGPQQIVDKLSNELRSIHYGDIALLCRTNERLQQLASAFAAAGIPVAYRRPGLLATPEGALGMACLRRLADSRDTLASAEIRILTREERPEDWLQDRLAFLQTDTPGWQWGEVGDDALPVLQHLALARKELPLLSPSEGLALALQRGAVRKAAIAWGTDGVATRHRLRNLDLLLAYARDYEDQYRTRNLAATVPGLILWFNQLAAREEDWQAEAGDERAVTLVTHHRAKGLEWPVVIAMDLDAKVRTRLWDLSVIPREDGIDVHSPLAGRRLQYWPWPFGKQSKDIAVKDRIEADEVGRRAGTRAVEEVRRLLYVSITRARDLLVIPLPVKNGKLPPCEWLDSLGGQDWMLPSADKTSDGGSSSELELLELELPNGGRIPAGFRELEAPESWKIRQASLGPAWVSEMPAGLAMLERAQNPSSAEPVADAVIGEPVQLGDRIPLDGVDDIRALGLMMHSHIAAEIQSPDDEAGTRTQRQLTDWGFAGCVEASALIASTGRFVDWIHGQLKPTAWLPEHPISHVLESGQVVSGFIDLLLQTEAGWVIIDHKTTPRPRGEWKGIATAYSGQLLAYKRAIEGATGQPVVQTWLHFPVGGGLIEVAFPR